MRFSLEADRMEQPVAMAAFKRKLIFCHNLSLVHAYTLWFVLQIVANFRQPVLYLLIRLLRLTLAFDYFKVKS